MKGHGAIEVAKTVIEVADVAWKAIECHHHHHHPHNHEGEHEHDREHDREHETPPYPEDELESLRCENRRLRNLLEQNLKLLQNVSELPCLLNDCPPDLYTHLVATVDSKDFLNRIKEFQQASIHGATNEFPFREATGADMQSAEVLINVGHGEASWWVWVTDEMAPSNVEEWSGIDDEKYVVISEEHVVDGVANFMARCILSNPKSLVHSFLRQFDFVKSIRWREQDGEGLKYMACWNIVLYFSHLGTCSCRVVSQSCCSEASCKGCSLDQQSCYEGSVEVFAFMARTRRNCNT
ncbi:hypothetical protein ACJRO7_025601 [Eucalyptus globulus]|uniref:Uncharacterized protein n=1 Tax=Eucalyptus globulus TaxID=34317 RepID=A0ABD3KFH7_EUCGL